MTFPQFVGASCGQHGPYTFYKAFKYFKHGKYKILTLGEFFFVRISSKEDPCIGELQLLWDDRNSDQLLSSVRLYFLPEQTPDGRQPHHGEHEVLAATDKVILKLEDLVGWITQEVDWTQGLLATRDDDNSSLASDETPSDSLATLDGLDSRDPKLIKALVDSQRAGNRTDIKDEKGVDIEDDKDSTELGVIILPYPKYCRYRAMMKRLNGVSNGWLKNLLVIALGGLVLSRRKSRILFCRDSFEHEELTQNDLNCEHLAPILKGRPRKKKGKGLPIVSPGSESSTSEENKDANVTAKLEIEKNGFQKPHCKDEQEFLQKLFKFMKERNTPIHRVPHLGFKQIDLYIFYTYAQKLGGYEKITEKKLWKHVYDELGGNPGSTSAATCTRRHYERLLLPFERYMIGDEDKPLPIPPPKPRAKKIPPDKIINQEACSENIPPTAHTEVSEESKDPDITVDNLKEESDSAQKDCKDFIVKNEQQNDVHFTENILNSIADTKMSNKLKIHRKDIIIHKGQNEVFCEKERRWNEIRKKNFLARKWVRQFCPEQDDPASLSLHMSNEPQQHVSDQAAVGAGKIPLSSNTTSLQKIQHHSQQPTTSTVNFSKQSHHVYPSHQKKIVLHHSQRAGSGEVKYNKLPNNGHKSHSLTPDDNKPFSKEQWKVSLLDSQSVSSNSVSNSTLANTSGIPNGTSLSSERTISTANNPGNVKLEISKLSRKSPIGCGILTPYPYKTSSDAVSQPPLKNDINTTLCKSEEMPRKCFAQAYSDYLSANSNAFSSRTNTEVPLEREENDKISQRRPSVIQHTESITSPSTSQSPIVLTPDSQSHTDFTLNTNNSEKVPDLAIKQLYNMTRETGDGNMLKSEDTVCSTSVPTPRKSVSILSVPLIKIPDFRAKRLCLPSNACKNLPTLATVQDSGILSTVAGDSCRNLAAVSNKIPDPRINRLPITTVSSCRTCKSPPLNGRVSKQQFGKVLDAGKEITSRASKSHVTNGMEFRVTCSLVTNQQKHTSVTLSPSMPYMHNTSKGCITSSDTPTCLAAREISEMNTPYYNQPKRPKLNCVPSPFTSEVSPYPVPSNQSYGTSFFPDIPKTVTVQHTYEGAVLDLSLKKPLQNTSSSVSDYGSQIHNRICSVDDGVCLDLSVKKKSTENESSNGTVHEAEPYNGIENITPPSPLSPAHSNDNCSPFPISPLKTLPSLLSLHGLVTERVVSLNSAIQCDKTKNDTDPRDNQVLPSLVMTPVTPPPNIPVDGSSSQMYSHSQAQALHTTKNSVPDHSQHLPPYMGAPLYHFSSSVWASPLTSQPSHISSSGNAHSGLTAYKELDQNLFSKQYSHSCGPQLYSVLCKDEPCYPSYTQ